MKAKFNIRKGDTVKVIAGDSKGQQGKVLMVDRAAYKALVEGVNMGWGNWSDSSSPDASWIPQTL